MLSKNGPTPNCSAAGAEIVGWTEGDTLSQLGFDFRKGGHCGAGAPRINVTDTSDTTYFFGCAHGTHSPAPQTPEWERVRFTGADGFPATFVFGETPVKSIEIVFDEGTDTANEHRRRRTRGARQHPDQQHDHRREVWPDQAVETQSDAGGRLPMPPPFARTADMPRVGAGRAPRWHS